MADDLTTPWSQQMLYGIVLPSLAGVAAFAAIVLTGDATPIRFLIAGVAGVAASALLSLAANKVMDRGFQKRLAARSAARGAEILAKHEPAMEQIRQRRAARND